MCGITGIISNKATNVSAEALVRMTDSIEHRGPDGEGYFITNSTDFLEDFKLKRPGAKLLGMKHECSIALGHRRLSILDLHDSAGQPMQDITERYIIVFNGEIYNHSDLRNELKLFGYKFNTDHSDTEVILNSYAHWGIECLKKFNGMWAFCIWDKVENVFFMARDRAGKKPFYFTEHNNQFYFASELKAILTNRDIPRELDGKAVYDFLTYMMVPSPKTIYRNVYKLPAAHYILYKPGETAMPIPYWSPLSNQPYLDLTEDQITEGIRDRIYEAARLRMLADVEVGVLLSGGLDSSINLACLSKYATQPIKAFSVGFENKSGYKNEFEYAKKVAKHFSAEYHELILTEGDFFDFYPKMVYYQDEPIADTANIPIYFIAKAARESGVKVLLGGEGSDELFIGYELWRLAKQFGNFMEGRPKLASIAAYLHKNSPAKNKRLYYHSWYKKVKRGEPVFWSGTELRSETEKSALLSREFMDSIGAYSSFGPISSFYKEYCSKRTLDIYDWMSAVDLRYRLPDLLLARLDRMLMAASVEGRNPFLDVNLIEFAMKIPARYKTKGNQEKYILKKAFEGILPNEIIYRKKDSFTVPLSSLFNRGNYKEQSIEAIRNFNDSTQIFSKNYINYLSSESKAPELWNISNLALWHQQYA